MRVSEEGGVTKKGIIKRELSAPVPARSCVTAYTVDAAAASLAAVASARGAAPFTRKYRGRATKGKGVTRAPVNTKCADARAPRIKP